MVLFGNTPSIISPSTSSIKREERKIVPSMSNTATCFLFGVCPETRFWVRGSGFLRRDEGVDDETYRKYVEEELRVAVKNPLPQSEWGFQTCSSRVDALNQFSTKRSAVDIRKSVGA